ncbi:MAG: hypothetical protein NT067_07290 [Candidatus Diapherotrites archaeon]|nr:hypothetical protein [Candidatus Diapherotrites archaeon]
MPNLSRLAKRLFSKKQPAGRLQLHQGISPIERRALSQYLRSNRRQTGGLLGPQYALAADRFAENPDARSYYVRKAFLQLLREGQENFALSTLVKFRQLAEGEVAQTKAEFREWMEGDFRKRLAELEKAQQKAEATRNNYDVGRIARNAIAYYDDFRRAFGIRGWDDMISAIDEKLAPYRELKNQIPL